MIRRFLRRTPPESKAAAVVLGVALLQVGLLATIGLRTTSQREAAIEAELAEQSRGILDRAVVNAGAARIAALEQTLQYEVERRGRPLHERIREALSRAPLHRTAYLVARTSGGRPLLFDHRRPPLHRAAAQPIDVEAREALDTLASFEHSDPEIVLARAPQIAADTDDPVAAALALQAGWRAAHVAKDDILALALAERVLNEFPAVVDDRGARAETAPFGAGAAALVCEVRLRASGDDPGAFVRAVAARRELAQRLRHLLGETGYAVEREECDRLLRETLTRMPAEPHDELEAALRGCDAIDAGLARAASVPVAALQRVLDTAEPGRLRGGAGADAVVLTVLPLSTGPEDGTFAVAFATGESDFRDQVLEPAREGVELPAGLAFAVRDESGAVVAGQGDGRALVKGRPFGPVAPGLTADVLLADASLVARETGRERRLWLWILVGAGLAVVAASLLGVRAILREVRVARMKGDFVSNLSHELRTPLTSLRMFVETLQEGRVRGPDEAREYLDIIARETERLSTLVDRILQFSAFSRGRAPLGLKSVDGGDIVRRAVEIFASRAQTAGATLRVEIAEDLPESLVDRDAMIQVLLNLLDNAVKYGGDKGIEIRVAARGAGSRVCLEVEDSGPGVPERERELVFEEFYRGDESLTSRVQGTGIGLALCRRIVLAHGGDIEVGRGARLGGAQFTVLLPSATVGRRLAVAAQQERD